MDDLLHYDAVVLPTGSKFHVRNKLEADFYADLLKDGSFNLSSSERWWSDHYNLFLSHGYQLRPRYHPDWKPSWYGTDINPYCCEDSYQHMGYSVIDAKRLKDGKIVAIKRIQTNSQEARIGIMLSSPERLKDPMNHCIPITDTFRDESDEEISFIVMPILRAFDDPPFKFVNEVVDFVRQTLEALVYIHGQNVAHRDLSDGNVMMDGRPLFGSGGFHPSMQNMQARDPAEYNTARPRSDVGPVDYYITDFGLSTHFEDANESRLVTGDMAQDADVPELSSFIPYDPFCVDVFTLGMVYKRNFLDVYTNVSFLSPLIHEMTKMAPKERPAAARALELFNELVTEMNGPALRWRLCVADEPLIMRITQNINSVLRELSFIAKSSVSTENTRKILAFTFFPITVGSFLIFYGPRRLFARAHGSD